MRTRVAVVYGGRSGEHEVSVRSAQAIMDGMDPAKYEIAKYFITKEGKWQPHPILPEPGSLTGIDVVFPVLHGTFGEDGTVQGLLELADVPYVGAGVLASSVSMDKEMMKRVCLERALPVVDYATVTREKPDVEAMAKRLPFPLFVKPANLGSSVGVSRATDKSSLSRAIELAARYDRKVMIEESVDAREIECAVLGNDTPQASLPGEYVVHDETARFLDYTEKYTNTGHVEFVVPAPISRAMIRRIQHMAVTAFQAIDGSGLSRVDFFLRRGDGELLINEINTLPGLTEVSGYPKMWEATGMPFPEVIDRLIELAIERHRERSRNETSI